MGAYAYCSKCNNGLNAPTPEDIFDGKKECPNCGKHFLIDDYARKELFLNLIERIEALEKMSQKFEHMNNTLNGLNKSLSGIDRRTSDLIRIG